MKIRKIADQIKSSLEKGEPVPNPRVEGPYLSTGSTLLNLALSDRVDGGFLPGKYYFLVGDSNSGKTFFSMTCFAEAMRNPHFKDYRLIYDNVEDGMLMNVRELFGKDVLLRVEPPRVRKGEPLFSDTIEDFYFNLDDAVKEGRPFIYVLDSMDGLSSEAEGEKFEERKNANRKGKTAKGSFGDGKAKKNSEGLRKVLGGLRSTGSILIIISQTRDNLNPMAFGEKKTRSGGRALRFYATCEIWTSPTGAVKKTVRGKPRAVGTGVQLKVVKNRITGKLATVETVIYPSYGIDDFGSCVDFLTDENVWRKDGSKIHLPGSEGVKREELLSRLDTSEKFRRKTLEKVGETWTEIQRDSALPRLPRYR